MATFLLVAYSCDRPEKAIPVPPLPVAAVTPCQALTTTMLRFDCTETEPGNKGDKIYFRWDWEDNGHWENGYGNTPVIKHTYFDMGINQPAVEVKDPPGLIGRYDQKLEVNQINTRLLVHFD